MKFLKKLFRGKNYEAREEFEKSFLQSFNEPKKETGSVINVTLDQFARLQDYDRHRTLEEKAALAAELAFRLEKAEETQDIDLWKEVEADARSYLKTQYDLFREATEVKKAEPELSKQALVSRVLEWGKKEGLI